VVIERLEPAAPAVEGTTGDAGALLCAIAHDTPGVSRYRYAVRALGTERLVEVPVIVARLSLEGNTTTGGAYTGVAADGATTLACLLEVPGWPGAVQVQAPAYGRLQTTAGEALEPGSIVLDPLGRAEFVYVPPAYLDVVSDTLTLPADSGRAAVAQGIRDLIPLVLTDTDGTAFTVPVEVPVYRPPVVLVHGLADGQAALQPLATYLASQGFDADLANYAPPTAAAEGTVLAQARLLRERLTQVLAGYARAGIKIARLDVVTLSTGGLAARRYLQDGDLYRGDVRKLVMLAPPNHGTGLQDRPLQAVQEWWQQRLGARAAEFWSGAAGIRALNAGEATGAHLRAGVEYAIVAGRLPAEEFIDPHLARQPSRMYVDSDGIVTVASAALEGVPLYPIDGAGHSAELSRLIPPRPEPGLADLRDTWDLVAGLLRTPIAREEPRQPRAALLACEACTWGEPGATPAVPDPSGTLEAWQPLVASGRGLVGLYAGEELWGLISLAPGTAIVLDTPSSSGQRLLVETGAVRCRTLGRAAQRTYSVLVGDAPAAGEAFAPLARAWDLGADFVVQATATGAEVTALRGQVVAETQNAAGVALGRLLGEGDAARVVTGSAPEQAVAPGDTWWADPFYDPPAPASAAVVRRLRTMALVLLALALLAGLAALADHGRLDPALAELSREGQSLRSDLADGAVRRSDLHALAAEDRRGRWWSYDPLTDSWSVADGDIWRPATPPRYSSRRLWLIAANVLLVLGLALGALSLIVRAG